MLSTRHASDGSLIRGGLKTFSNPTVFSLKQLTGTVQASKDLKENGSQSRGVNPQAPGFDELQICWLIFFLNAA
jgi:hypothetical protein